MSNLSKFEKEAQAQQERTRREANIATIEQELLEARNILDVVPKFEERAIVRREIERLEGMLADETRLLNSVGISKEDTDKIVASMKF